ncbi:sensor histidine kinase [Cohnella terricola]|uniref:Heme sensor protein HssS n=1 Tax=Cohnella terricola TaxID=1289167 RepID=A0A559JQT9_9BACL|nr:sensor histidine kinase [Cohnella terricola]TVY02242.1 HAMP domain-containing protein [Cohnella terricola]
MIKSLYVRVVLFYMAAVLVGIISTYFLTLLMISSLGDRYVARLQNELLEDGRSIQELYRKFGIERADDELKEGRLSGKYEIKLYDGDGKMIGKEEDKRAGLFTLSGEVVHSVLNGETFKNFELSPTEFVVGLPYEEAGKRYALFIELSEQRVESFGSLLLILAFAINLIVGALMILIAARYLVKPLLGMKSAAERMAKGEFDIELKWAKRKDELGRLAHSFNEMASQMSELETMRQNFVSNVSHEIQSPLTSISGFSKALQQSGVAEEDRIRYLSIIQNESERLSRLSDNLLKLASLDTSNHPFEPRDYELDEQLRKAVVACEPQWTAKSLEWDLRLPKTMIRGDEDQLNQVWVNLIGNSIKFTPDGGRISLSIMKYTEHVEVVLSDTGIGIPIGERVKVFERFYKADHSRNKMKSGSGLGLAIVKKIVIKHRGDVVLKGNSNGGTTVIVSLPFQTKFQEP